MRIVYVAETLALPGGVKGIVEHAAGLAARGHEVSIVTKESSAWIDVAVPVLTVPRFDREFLPEADVHVATWFPTVVPVARAGRARVVFHFCQGYEPLYPFQQDRRAEMLAAYDEPVPKLLLSPHLVDVLAGHPGTLYPLPPGLRVDDYAPPDPDRREPRRPPVIGVVGPWELSIKGVETSLRAVARLRAGGLAVRLHRASQVPQLEAERLVCPSDTYVCLASYTEMIRWYQGLDLYLFGSTDAEGLGLPPFEALAAGVPLVATEIPSLRVLPDGAVRRVPVGDDAAMADAARRILTEPGVWAERRRAGLVAIQNHRLSRTIDALEAAMETEIRRSETVVRGPRP